MKKIADEESNNAYRTGKTFRLAYLVREEVVFVIYFVLAGNSKPQFYQILLLQGMPGLVLGRVATR